ncbi:hypothetical protein AB6813_01570 [bacterium RCC_150]
MVIFRELAAEFFVANAALEDPDEPRASIDSTRGQGVYWLQLFRLMMLRKFVARDDQVQLPKVADALRACNHDGNPDVTQWAEYIESSFAGRELATMQATLGALLPEGDKHDPLELMLYGRLLHADADKFRFTQGLYDFDRYVVAFVGSAELQKAVEYAMIAVARCMNDGIIREHP